MSDERVELIKAMHRPVGGNATLPHRLCACGAAWPCDAAYLLARVAELEAAIRAVQGEHYEERPSTYLGCRICSPQDGHWPCLVRMELDAVLPPEERG